MAAAQVVETLVIVSNSPIQDSGTLTCMIIYATFLSTYIIFHHILTPYTPPL